MGHTATKDCSSEVDLGIRVQGASSLVRQDAGGSGHDGVPQAVGIPRDPSPARTDLSEENSPQGGVGPTGRASRPAFRPLSPVPGSTGGSRIPEIGRPSVRLEFTTPYNYCVRSR